MHFCTFYELIHHKTISNCTFLLLPIYPPNIHSTYYTINSNHCFCTFFKRLMARYNQLADWGTSWVVSKLPCLGLHDPVSVFFLLFLLHLVLAQNCWLLLWNLWFCIVLFPIISCWVISKYNVLTQNRYIFTIKNKIHGKRPSERKRFRWTDGWKDGRTERWMDRHTLF